MSDPIPAMRGRAVQQAAAPARPRRRALLRGLGAAGLACAGVRVHAIEAPAAGAEGRFVMIFLRGGLDGLFAFAPVADPALESLRPNLSRSGRVDGIALGNSGFAAHPSCRGFADLYAARELLFCPGAGTSDASRSHFQAQDLFEIGSGASQGPSGFMARLGQALGAGRGTRGAISFTRELPLAFAGADNPPDVAPLTGAGLRLPPSRMLDAIRRAHAGLKSGEALDQALATQAEIDMAMDRDGAARGAAAAAGFAQVAPHLGRILRANRRLGLAFADIGGFDTHANQEGVLTRVLSGVTEGVIALKEALGADEWARTRVALMSEFGRTARENGTQGTDHGRGGLFVLAGGGLGGGRMAGDFAGLSATGLNEGRDLRVTADWRDLLGEVAGSTFGLSRGALDRVFPGRPGRRTGL